MDQQTDKTTSINANGRFELYKLEAAAPGSRYAVYDDGKMIWSGELEDLHGLAKVVNRFLTLGQLAGQVQLDTASMNGQWLSTAGAMKEVAEAGLGLTSHTIRQAARKGRFIARQDQTNRWWYEKGTFIRWLRDPQAHRAGRRSDDEAVEN